jgi:hypothetical protein
MLSIENIFCYNFLLLKQTKCFFKVSYGHKGSISMRSTSKVEFLLQARQRNRAVALQALIRWSRIGTTGMICGKE